MEQKEIYIETERIIIRNFKQKDAEVSPWRGGY